MSAPMRQIPHGGVAPRSVAWVVDSGGDGVTTMREQEREGTAADEDRVISALGVIFRLA